MESKDDMTLINNMMKDSGRLIMSEISLRKIKNSKSEKLKSESGLRSAHFARKIEWFAKIKKNIFLDYL